MNGAPTLPSDSPQKGNITILINRIPTTYPLVALQKDPFRNQYLSLICRLGSKCKWGITSNKLSNTLSSWGAALVVGLVTLKKGQFVLSCRPSYICLFFPPATCFPQLCLIIGCHSAQVWTKHYPIITRVMILTFSIFMQTNEKHTTKYVFSCL